MTSAGRIEVFLTGNTTGLNAALRRANASLGRVGRNMRQAGMDISTGLTLPLALVGGTATKLATTFDSEMTKIETLVGVNKERVDEWRESILALAPAVGRGPNELARAMFVVTSAGERGANALKILEQAAKASAIGLGDTTAIARSVTSAMRAYANEGLTAARATEILVATVREGNLEASDLAGSLGRVLGIASQVGVTFDQVGAFVATFTRLGVNAEEAVTSLRGILSTVIKPTKQAREALAEFGLSIDDVRASIEERGLAQTLIDLVELMGGNQDAIGAIIPNIRALSGILGTAAAQGDDFVKIADNISESLGIVTEGFERTKDTPAQSFREFKAEVEVLAIRLGNELAPALSNIVKGLSPVFEAIAKAIRVFSNFSDTAKVQILAVATAIGVGGPLAIAVGGFITVLGALAGPIGLAIGAIAGIGAAAIAVVRHWDDLVFATKFTWIDIRGAINLGVRDAILTIQQIIDKVQNFINVMAAVPSPARAAWQLAADGIAAVNQPLQDAARGLDEANLGLEEARTKLIAESLAQDEAKKSAEDAVDPIKALADALGGGGASLGERAGEAATELTPLQEEIANLRQELHIADESFALMGANFDLMGEKASILQTAIQNLIAAGAEHNTVVLENGMTLAELAQMYVEMSNHLDEMRRKQGEATDTIKESTEGISGVLAAEGKTAGRAFVRGMISGTGSMGDALKRAIFRLIQNSIFGVITSAFQFGSPSRKGVKIGRDFVSSIALGIDREAPAVSSSIGRLAIPRLPVTGGLSAIGGFEPSFTSGVPFGGGSGFSEALAEVVAQTEPTDPIVAARKREALEYFAEVIHNLEEAGVRTLRES